MRKMENRGGKKKGEEKKKEKGEEIKFSEIKKRKRTKHEVEGRKNRKKMGMML
jgi:hypothetical protein